MLKQPEMMVEKYSGWNLFTPEVAWFIHDFFKYDLNGYEKLIFYSYYINGLTMEQIADSANCSFQYIGAQIKNIDKKLHYRWKNKKSWKVPNDR